MVKMAKMVGRIKSRASEFRKWGERKLPGRGGKKPFVLLTPKLAGKILKRYGVPMKFTPEAIKELSRANKSSPVLTMIIPRSKETKTNVFGAPARHEIEICIGRKSGRVLAARIGRRWVAMSPANLRTRK